MKKFTVFLLIATILFSVIACGKDSDKVSNGPSNTNSASTSNETNKSKADDSKAEESAFEFPLKETATLTIFTPLDTKAAMMVTTYDDLLAFKAIEERLMLILSGSIHPVIMRGFTLMVAAGDYPDIIYWNWLNEPGSQKNS